MGGMDEKDVEVRSEHKCGANKKEVEARREPKCAFRMKSKYGRDG